MKRKIIAGVLSLSMILSMSAPSFADGEWWRDGFNFVYYHNPKIMDLDQPEGVFNSNREVSRYEVADALWKYENKPEVSGERFRDVSRFDGAVNYVSGKGIMKGIDNYFFDPDSNVTREQMATILYRFANETGYDTNTSGRTKHFRDSSQISDWAKDAVNWVVSSGLMEGTDLGFEPLGSLTRGQIATILYRFSSGGGGTEKNITRTEVKRIEARENRATHDDREIFVDNLGWLLRQTNSGVVECFYQNNNTVLICFQDGDVEVSVAGMSYDEIIKAVINEVIW